MENIKRKKKYSFRNRMIGFYICSTFLLLIVCGAVLLLSVWRILSSYIDKDLKFFLQETNSNLNNQMEYLEEMVYSVRENSILKEYLAGAAKNKPSRYSEEEVQKEFQNAVDIFSSNNAKNGTVPFVEGICLFDRTGNYYSVNYFPLFQSEADKNKEKAVREYEAFRKDFMDTDGKRDYKYSISVDKKYVELFFVLYDDTLEEMGTLLYRIRTESLLKAMEKVGQYQGAFWFIFDENGSVLVRDDKAELNGTVMTGITEKYCDQPYDYLVNGKEYLLDTERMSMNLSCSIGIPRNQAVMLLLNSTGSYLVIISAITIVTSLLGFLMIHKMTRPIKEITDKLQMVKEDEFEAKLPDYRSEEFHDISRVFNSMTEHISYLINIVYEKQLSVKELELKFLQSQMNPHFMFNVLNSIALKARMEQQDEIARMISSFSGLIQAGIYRKETEKIQIRQELIYVDYYLYLQSFRYGERLSYRINKEEDVLDFYIPKLCIQIAVENAVVHGIEPKMSNCSVEVNIYTEENDLFIDIIDDGVGFDFDGEVTFPIVSGSSSEEHNHVGLNNVYSIIQMMYGEDYGVTVYSERGKGAVVSICVPQDVLE